MTTSTSEDRNNRRARELALSKVGPAVNLLAPTVTFESRGRVLVLGAEHWIRLALDRLDASLQGVGLVSEAMPEQVTPAMQAAAQRLAQAGEHEESAIFRLPLKQLKGFLGQFQVQVEVDGQRADFARLALGQEHFDMVLDLGRTAWLQAPLKPAGYVVPDELADPADLDPWLGELSGLQGRFEKPRYVQINTEICAHSRNEKIGCTRCLSVCPADAIHSVEQLIQIDTHLCHGAGGCASACPTSAIRYLFPQPQLTLETLQHRLQAYQRAGGQSPAILLHDAGEGWTWLEQHLETLPGHWLPMQVEEAGAAGMEVWLAALAWGAQEVLLLAEESLPETVAATLDSEMRVANAVLEAMGHGCRITRLTPAQLLSREASDAAPICPPGAADANDVVDKQAGKRRQISQAFEMLYRHAASAAQSLSLKPGDSFGAVLIQEERCTLCLSCVSTCPTQALQSGGDEPLLSFTEEHCVQCGLCVDTCPENALALQPRYLLDPEKRRAKVTLKREAPFHCIRCGKPFATQGMVAMMLDKLVGHSMFSGEALQRLKMCEDCRVIDIVRNDPGSDLFEHAKGRQIEDGELNLAAPSKPSKPPRNS